jgi:hypothetical protein
LPYTFLLIESSAPQEGASSGGWVSASGGG